jgi:diadenosine tetraphosphate (Ap4A) HIT family hydrolase
MASCALCELRDIMEAVVFEGSSCYVAINPFPSIAGELIIVPNEHYTIFEQIPQETLTEMAVMAKYFSAVLFETLSCQGTNIVVQNGSSAGQVIAHTSIRIIPRMSTGDIDTGWEPLSVSKEEMDEHTALITSALNHMGDKGKQPSNKKPEQKGGINPIVQSDKKPDTREERNDFFKRHWEEDDVMKKQLFRNP